MPIQTTGKTRILEAKKLQAPKPQAAMTQEELMKKVAATPGSGGSSPSGIGTLPPSYPGQTVTTGELKPEFRETGGIAEQLKTTAKIPVEQQLPEIPTGNVFVPGQPTEYQKIDAMFANLKKIPLIGTLIGAVKQEDRLANLKSIATDIITGLETGRIRPEDAQAEIRKFTTEIAKEDQRVQLEAKFDISKLLSGQQTNAELDMVEIKNLLVDTELNAATKIQEKRAAEFQAGINRPYTPGAGGK